MVSTIGHLVYAFSVKWWLFIVAMVISSMGMAGHPAMLALTTGAVDASKRGAVLGAMGALQAVCSLVGGVVDDNLFAYFISGHAFILFPGPQFILGSFLFACAASCTAMLFIKYSAKQVAHYTTLSVQEEKDVGEQKPLLINESNS